MEALEEFVGGNTQILVRWMRVRRSHRRVFVLNKDKLVVASTTGGVFFFCFFFLTRLDDKKHMYCNMRCSAAEAVVGRSRPGLCGSRPSS